MGLRTFTSLLCSFVFYQLALDECGCLPEFEIDYTHLTCLCLFHTLFHLLWYQTIIPACRHLHSAFLLCLLLSHSTERHVACSDVPYGAAVAHFHFFVMLIRLLSSGPGRVWLST